MHEVPLGECVEIRRMPADSNGPEWVTLRCVKHGKVAAALPRNRIRQDAKDHGAWRVSTTAAGILLCEYCSDGGRKNAARGDHAALPQELPEKFRTGDSSQVAMGPKRGVFWVEW